VLRAAPGSPLAARRRRDGRAYRRTMPSTVLDLVPLLTLSSAAGVQSQTFMPFVLLAVPVVLALLLLFVLGRRRTKKPGQHD